MSISSRTVSTGKPRLPQGSRASSAPALLPSSSLILTTLALESPLPLEDRPDSRHSSSTEELVHYSSRINSANGKEDKRTPREMPDDDLFCIPEEPIDATQVHVQNRLPFSGIFADLTEATYNGQRVVCKSMAYDAQNLNKYAENERSIMKLLASSEHSHLFVEYLGYYLSNSPQTYCIVMGYAPYYDLFEYANNDPSFQNATWDDVFNIIKKIILSLHSLHSLGILHRDIKLENFLVTGTSPVTTRLTDFGFARKYLNRVYPNMQGTPGMMAPEVINHETTTPKSDIFSLGMTINLLAHLKLGPLDESNPYFLEDSFQQQQLLIKGKRPPIHKQCDHKIAELITRCWQQSPHQRPSTEELVKTFCDDANRSSKLTLS